MIFKIDGYEFNHLPIFSFEPKLSVVDTEGTGRTSAAGQPIFRDPAGTFWNLTIVFGGAVIEGANEDFLRLVEVLKSYGQEQFHSITFSTPDGNVITQNMYCTSANFSLQRVTRFGELFWKPLSLNFIAERAYIV